jgi:hypothetical protein
LGAQETLERKAVAALLAALGSVHVDSELTIKEELRMAPPIAREVEEALGKFKVVEQRHFSDGGLSAVVEVPLAAVAKVFRDESAAITEGTAGKGTKFSSLLVDARRIPVVPGLKPRILDPAAKVLLGPELWTDEQQNLQTPLRYVDHFADARKLPDLGRNPLVVKAVQAQGVDLVISNADAKKLKKGWPAAGGVALVGLH